METKPGEPSTAKRWAFQGLMILACFLIIGEIAFRLPYVPGLLRYEFDAQLGWRLVPDQKGCLFLGGMSYLSPPIGINQDGYRNSSLDWNGPMVLCLGSSEALGAGVKDNEVWTAQLTTLLNQDEATSGTVSVNAGGPGFGPYHSRILLERFLDRKRPEAVVVRVSLGDRNFLPPSPHTIVDMERSAERKRIIQSLSRFLPFLVNKLEAQKIAIAATFQGDTKDPYAGSQEGAFTGEAMWERFRAQWSSMAQLCAMDSVPLTFVIDDPLETEAGARLRGLFEESFATQPLVGIQHFGEASFGLGGGSADERRKHYRERFTLKNDPHANREKHDLLARFVLRSLEPRLVGRIKTEVIPQKKPPAGLD
ncbi:MAG: hypothetical protein M3Y08_04930 [Fibrobacterota bacterium]|nr:hypothetical protein [Fibrobacterota bacterium]